MKEAKLLQVNPALFRILCLGPPKKYRGPGLEISLFVHRRPRDPLLAGAYGLARE
jgi:hypothetical protein